MYLFFFYIKTNNHVIEILSSMFVTFYIIEDSKVFVKALYPVCDVTDTLEVHVCVFRKHNIL